MKSLQDALMLLGYQSLYDPEYPNLGFRMRFWHVFTPHIVYTYSKKHGFSVRLELTPEF